MHSIKKIKVEEVQIVYARHWNKWPDTQDTDFEQILKWRNPRTVIDPNTGTEIEITSRIYPAYLPYIKAQHLHLHPQCNIGGDINNTLLPHNDVINQWIADLSDLSKECEIIVWHHGMQCFPPVSKYLPSLFKLPILIFGDDCPGSSEIKTFPIIKDFTALIHQMLTWDYQTGTRTVNKYQEIHPNLQCYHQLGGPTDHLTTWKDRINFSILHAKRPILLSFIGCIGWMNPARVTFMQELNVRACELGENVRLYGKDMRDSYLAFGQGEGPAQVRPIGEIYAETQFGINYPASSIFNARFFDLPLMGVIPIMYDKNKELPVYGIKPHIHYLPFDGTVNHLFAVIEGYKDTDLSAMQKAGEAKALELLKEYTLGSVLNNVIIDNLEKMCL